MSIDEIEIVRQAQSGDREAFGRLMKLHAGAVYNFAHRYMPDKDDVDDVVQDVFLKAFQNLSRFDPSQRLFKSWLFKITANTSLDILKKRRHAEGYKKEHNPGRGMQFENPGVNESSVHNRRELQYALQDLPDRERQAVLLFFYHDLTHREISDVLWIPLGTVKSRLRSAMIRLRQQLL